MFTSIAPYLWDGSVPVSVYSDGQYGAFQRLWKMIVLPNQMSLVLSDDGATGTHRRISQPNDLPMQKNDPGVTGLRNLHNTCYMNAVLQCLSCTTPLVEYFFSWQFETFIAREKKELANAFAKLMADMWFGKYQYVSPEDFLSAICNVHPPFGKHSQQDAQELLIYTLNALHEDLTNECLENFFEQVTLTTTNKIFCPLCKIKQDASVKTQIWKLPKILILHLKRFEYKGQLKRKLKTNVDFPMKNLDLKPFLSTLCVKHQKYRLYAVVNHYGELDYGHYTAFCKNPGTKEWNAFDDISSVQITESAVKTSSAYILFYTNQAFSFPKKTNSSIPY
ncbi:inactive ubiquitin carboxyl-terminal hydrolase 50 isoform X6 [Hyla sarda]|uniref:inactive ubiquitin carboxyl-terminal hydrolase 50 isoform X6 n=1 Tax=Hyla sarda TaxID=327740 RepID=UPI0024C2C2A8|nr:inactive ubiquitin carboxyl-terminal hydrolase 50 isoform X6 [Hyla sarda]